MVPNPPGSSLLEMGNSAAIAVAKANAPTKRTKYIDVRYHHIMDKVRDRIITLVHTPSAIIQADALTKPLDKLKFRNHCTKLCLAPHPKHTHGCRSIITAPFVLGP